MNTKLPPPIPPALLGDWIDEKGNVSRYGADGINYAVNIREYKIISDTDLHWGNQVYKRIAGKGGLLGVWEMEDRPGKWEKITLGVNGYYGYDSFDNIVLGGSYFVNSNILSTSETRSPYRVEGNCIHLVDGNQNPAKMTFVIDGDTLTLASNGKITVLKRVKLY